MEKSESPSNARQGHQPERRVRPLRLLWRVIRSTRADVLLSALLMLIFIFAGVISMCEPQMHSYGDALWYCFSVITTIGFGDIVAQTTLGRVLSILLGIFGILVIGVAVGVVTAYYNEFLRVREQESLDVFAEQLEHLSELSPDELEAISERVKRMRARGRMS